MNRLTNRDLDSLFRAIGELYHHPNFKTLPELVVSLLAQLLPCEISSYNEVDRLNGQLRAVHNSDPCAAAHFPAYMAYAHEHPIPEHVAKSGDLSAHKLSDFVSTPVFEKTALYNEFYHHFGIHHQIAYFPAASKKLDLALFLFRGKRDFSERDRQVLNHIGPHVAQALRNRDRLKALYDQMEAQADCIRHFRLGVVLLIEESVLWMNELAQQWFDAFFPDWPGKSRQLPPLVRNWLKQLVRTTREKVLANPQKPLIVNKVSRRLAIQYSPGTDGKTTLLLTEETFFISPADFKYMGLTPRECEVFYWVCEGKNNPEIGILLGVSPNTIRKHVEHILAKLGVETRGAAMRRVRDLRNERFRP
jgi:DNA-binding CsgD family transcriptional regulator